MNRGRDASVSGFKLLNSPPNMMHKQYTFMLNESKPLKEKNALTGRLYNSLFSFKLIHFYSHKIPILTSQAACETCSKFKREKGK